VISKGGERVREPMIDQPIFSASIPLLSKSSEKKGIAQAKALKIRK
jgi:hypothetical protein